MSCKTFGIIVVIINHVHTNTKSRLKVTTIVAVNRKLLLRLENEPNEVQEPYIKLSEQNTCTTASTHIGRDNMSFNCKNNYKIIRYVFFTIPTMQRMKNLIANYFYGCDVQETYMTIS